MQAEVINPQPTVTVTMTKAEARFLRILLGGVQTVEQAEAYTEYRGFARQRTASDVYKTSADLYAALRAEGV